MSRTDLVAGLDIGTTKTCMVIAETGSDGRLEIIGEGTEPSQGLQKGVVIDIDATAGAIRRAAEKAQRVAGALVSSVFVGVSGEHVASVNSRGIVAISHARRQVRQEDVDRAVDSSRAIVLPPEREIISVIPRSYAIDGQDGVRVPVGMSGARLEVETHIVHGMSSFLQNLGKCVQKSGLSLEGLVLASYASARAVLTDAEKTLGVAIVDIGGGTTDIAVYSGGSIVQSGVIPIGGVHVSQDVSVGLQCALAEAERVKIANGASSAGENADETFEFTRVGGAKTTTLPRQILLEIIEPRMTEIFQLVEGMLIKGGTRGMIPGGIVLTGGGSLLRGAAELGERVLGIPVRLGKLNSVGGISSAVSSPIKATAVGLALHGADQIAGDGTAPAKGVGGFFTKIKDALLGSDS